MKLPNSLTGPSNRVEDEKSSRRSWHRWMPAWLLMAYLGCFVGWPALQNLQTLFFAPFGLLIGYSYWFIALGLPKEFHMPLAVMMSVTLFSLPWFSILASSRRASALCTLGVGLLLLTQFSGCRFQMHKGRWSAADETQAQRACAMQPRVRRTLCFESPHVFISPNRNGVPSKVDRSQAFTMSSNSRGMDATPLGLVVGIACGSSRYPGLFQPWAIIRKPVGLERKDADHAPASLRPRLASIKARNCSIVSARDGSRSKRSHRASNLRFSASLISRELSSVSMGVGRCMSATSGFLSPSQPRSHSLFAS